MSIPAPLSDKYPTWSERFISQIMSTTAGLGKWGRLIGVSDGLAGGFAGPSPAVSRDDLVRGYRSKKFTLRHLVETVHQSHQIGFLSSSRA